MLDIERFNRMQQRSVEESHNANEASEPDFTILVRNGDVIVMCESYEAAKKMQNILEDLLRNIRL